MAPSTVLLKNWKDSLRVNEKKNIFAFLSREAVHLPLPQGKELCATDVSGVLCSPAESHLARLAPCLQEEAGTRILLHVADAVQKGCKKVTIHMYVLLILIWLYWLWLYSARQLLMSCGVPLVSDQAFGL